MFHVRSVYYCVILYVSDGCLSRLNKDYLLTYLIRHILLTVLEKNGHRLYMHCDL